MAMILAELLPYSLLLCAGTTTQPRLDQRVLYAWESVSRGNQFSKIVGKTLSKYLFIKSQFSEEILSILECWIHWISMMHDNSD